jgi:thymidylate kinase
MDIPMGNDLYESFTHYQGKLVDQFDHLAADYQFDTVDAMHGVDEIHEYLWGKVSELVRSERPAAIPRIGPTP